MLLQEFKIATWLRTEEGLEGKDLKFIEDLIRLFSGPDKKRPLSKEEIRHLDELIAKFGIDISDYNLKKLRTQQKLEDEKHSSAALAQGQ